ncbi:LuxR C-terminal-related transcriptional regulator [Cyanobium sp. WAJ14-Wanaka]|uniref:response regulator transcription factor n=1 Tax=Cyanobium sp. WAJ14-Wanaka TaxID=2823725 RepID=UPI0020CC8ED2|nr:LuxR C-terminal-related transcriptional regulator [Cyanobium sp. WAJ14-Wanaka]MCP9774314.1 response regulator transcription factor [Cyanobium sp. WAJ14-Wanaka]
MVSADIRQSFPAKYAELEKDLAGYAVISVMGSSALLSLAVLQYPRIDLWAESLSKLWQLPIPDQGPLLICCSDDLPDGSLLDLLSQLQQRLGPQNSKRPIKVLALLDSHTDGPTLKALLRAGVHGLCCIDAVGEGQALLALATILRESVFIDDRFSRRLAEPSGPSQCLGSVGGLSDRERTVLQLLSAGYSSAEMAGRLRIRPDTVRRYLSDAYQKIGVRDRSQAVAWCLNQGLMTRRELQQLFG